MGKYLLQVSYTAEGAKGILKEGGTHRRAFIEDMVKKNGGMVEAFYFTFGADDVVVIVDSPDQKTIAALGLAVAASGAARTRTTVLLTPEDIDDASQMTTGYKPPGA